MVPLGHGNGDTREVLAQDSEPSSETSHGIGYESSCLSQTKPGGQSYFAPLTQKLPNGQEMFMLGLPSGE